MATRENGLLTTLNAKLAKGIEAERVAEPQPIPPRKPEARESLCTLRGLLLDDD
jgi:hypothetical protein